MLLNYTTGFNYKGITPASNGILYVPYKEMDYERLIYALTYASASKPISCHYCGKDLSKKGATLDHVVPRSRGGISIPGNLVVCCRKCNSNKSSFTDVEFQQWKDLTHIVGKKQAEIYRQNVHEESLGIMAFPDEMIVGKHLNRITCPEKGRKQDKYYYKELAYFKKYGHLSHPLVIDANGILLKGKGSWEVAISQKLRVVQSIQLENLVVSF